VSHHVITVMERVGPYDSKTWLAMCSCGRYSSGPCSEAEAARRGEEHRAAKEKGMGSCAWCGDEAVAVVNDRPACEQHLDAAFALAVPKELADLLMRERRGES